MRIAWPMNGVNFAFFQADRQATRSRQELPVDPQPARTAP